MIDVRPMTGHDVAAAALTWHEANDATRARFGLPRHPATPADLGRLESRIAYLAGTDPEGSWVATDGGEVVGLAQSFVRDGYWVLSLFAVRPRCQRAGVGRRLLAEACRHGAGLPGTIQCSRDPAAMRLYQSAGFDLHPAMTAFGPVRKGSVAAHPRVRPGDSGDLELAAAVDRTVRGAERTADLAFLLAADDTRLLVVDDLAYAVVKDEQVVTIGAVEPEAAGAVLESALAACPDGHGFQVMWMTAPQQWAFDTVRRAGLDLMPLGPVMVRGMDGPPRPFLPSGGLG